MDTNTASIPVRTLAQFPPKERAGVPQRGQGAEPQWGLEAKPAETGKFVTMSVNFYADILGYCFKCHLCDFTVIELNELFV